MLPMCIPLGRRQVAAQFLRRSAPTIAGGVALDTPPLSQRACVYRIEAELVEQMGHSGFGMRLPSLDLRVHSTKVNSVFTLRAARPTKYRSTHLVMIATNQHRNYATAGPRPKRTRRDLRGLR